MCRETTVAPAGLFDPFLHGHKRPRKADACGAMSRKPRDRSPAQFSAKYLNFTWSSASTSVFQASETPQLRTWLWTGR